MEATATTRAEHLAWCKQRALDYIDKPSEALASMGSDLNKHPETANHSGVELGLMMLMSNLLRPGEETRKFIEGFN